MLFDGIHSISVEKAVGTNDGTIVAFCLRNSALALDFCEPWASPTVIRSSDEGKTFTTQSVIPINTYNRAYGSLLFTNDGTLHSYAYN